jgi:hypothetical protein
MVNIFSYQRQKYKDPSILTFKKIENFRILASEIDTFIETCFLMRKVERETIENLCNVLIEVQNNFSRELYYIKPSNYFYKQVSIYKNLDFRSNFEHL